MSRHYRIVLHIGTEKTGSTALQGALYRHRMLLQSHGLAYWHSPGRQEARGLASAALDDQAGDDYLEQLGCMDTASREAFRQRELADLQSMLEGLPPSVHTVLISSEHFHSRLRQPGQLQWLKQILAPFSQQIEVVVYLRRQVDLVASFYSTHLKNGGSQKLENVARSTCHPRNHYYNYHMVLDLWSRVFGEEALRVRLFDASFLEGRTIQEDFLSLVQCPEVAIHAMSAPERHNESLIPAGQVMLRALNMQVAGLSQDEVQEHDCLEALRHDLIREYRGSGLQLKAADANSLQTHFEASNEWVRQRWFSDRARLFDPVEEAYGQGRGPLQDMTSAQLTLAEAVVAALAKRVEEGQPLTDLDPCANWFRDLAVQRETSAPNTALRLMTLAHRIRPRGPFIARKLEFYRERMPAQPSSGMNALWRHLRDLLRS